MKNKNIKKLAAIFATIVVMSTSLAPLAFAGTLTSTSLSAADLTPSATTSYTAGFTIENTLEPYQYFVMIFPSGYNVSAATVNYYTACSSSTYPTQQLFYYNATQGWTANSIDIQFIMGMGWSPLPGSTPGPAAHVTCTIENIVNPSSSGVTGNFEIRTQTTPNPIDLLDLATAVPGVTISGGTPVPEFSTYMYILTIIAAGWMFRNKFQKQEN